MNSDHPDTELYRTLREEYPDIVVENGIYIIPAFGCEFGVQEMDGRINLIYKGRIIKTYPIDESVVKKVVDILEECLFIFDPEELVMHIFINVAHIVWYARNIFLSGELYISGGIYEKDSYESSTYIDGNLSAEEVMEELFKRRPDLPFIRFKYRKQSFTYIYKSID